ncbi:MAG: glycerol-3-phosphate ABC transporter ATP-binding protein [Dehalococcoidia bacterium]|nr:glycerol-3-phosphate ABC transporter ATP-binding protein [Dehalococcoidia bacterium]
MASVTLDRLTKRFGQIVAVNNVTLEVRDREFLVLVGPSGCGKSTTLRLIAGLEEVSDGNVFIGERLVNDVAPKDRDIAMVFQSYALYPHMSVYDNLAFGLKLRRTPKREIDRRVQDAAELLGIGQLLTRKPKQLSGGQRQRVALGRAIVREPKVFLMDEPLSNLDAKLRVSMRAELIKLHQRLQTTMIYVTHDQTEAMTMGTRIAVLRDGLLQQLDTPQQVYDHPSNMFVAGFIGSPSMNFVEARLTGTPDDIWVDAESFKVQVPEQHRSVLAEHLDKEVFFGVRPEDLFDPKYSPPDITDNSGFKAQVDVTELLGSLIYLYLLVGDHQMVAVVDPRTEFKTGDDVTMMMDMNKMHIFDRHSQEAYL